jgi:uncharacterized protein YkwD
VRWLGGVTAAGLSAAVALIAPMVHAAPANARGCRGAHAPVRAGHLGRARRATLCLVNRKREHHGLHRLRANGELKRAAVAHTRDMVARRYFAHVAPSGATPAARAISAKYITPTVRWEIGECLGWGYGRAQTPAAIVRHWMHSPPHRAIVLASWARDAGVGVAHRSPFGGPGATYTLDVGERTAVLGLLH